MPKRDTRRYKDSEQVILYPPPGTGAGTYGGTRRVNALLAEKCVTESTGKKYFDMSGYMETRAEEDNQEIEAEIQKDTIYSRFGI